MSENLKNDIQLYRVPDMQARRTLCREHPTALYFHNYGGFYYI